MRAIMFFSAAFICGTAHAQTQSGPSDTMKLLQELNRKVDRLQADVDRMKKEASKAAPTTTTAVSQPPDPGTVPQTKKGGGWAVGVYPAASENQTQERVGWFIAPPGGFALGDFRRTVSHPGWASFQAEGQYNATEAGRYAFSTRVVWPKVNVGYTAVCSTKTMIDGKTISSVSFEGSTSKELDRNVNGGVDLQPQLYDVQVNITCVAGRGGEDTDRNMNADKELTAWFDRTRLIFGSTGPNDMSVRAPTVQELMHDVKAKKS